MTRKTETETKGARRPIAVSLFAGCGGDTLGLIRAGFDVPLFVENGRNAIASHLANFPGSRLLGESVGGDIRQIPTDELASLEGRVDLLFAGFPCQGFSHAGKKDPRDPRNQLFWEFVRFAQIIKPRWVVGENVSGLLHRTTDDGTTPVGEVINSALGSAGFRMAQPFVLDAVNFGVPQRRRRVFFVGSRDGLPYRPPSPSSGGGGPASRARQQPIRPLVEFSMEGAVPFDPGRVSGGVPSFCEGLSGEVPTGSPHPYLVAKLKEGQVSYGKRISPFHVEVADLDAPAKTIHSGYAFQPRLFVPLRNKAGAFLRTFSVLELSQIQGFPRSFILKGSPGAQIAQVGNAVPPPLVRSVACQVAACDDELSGLLEPRLDLRVWAESAPTPG